MTTPVQGKADSDGSRYSRSASRTSFRALGVPPVQRHLRGRGEGGDAREGTPQVAVDEGAGAGGARVRRPPVAGGRRGERAHPQGDRDAEPFVGAGYRAASSKARSASRRAPDNRWATPTRSCAVAPNPIVVAV